jgi:hypothetical protein
VRHTSWSEISTWSACRMRWYFAYHRNLRPRRTATHITVGSLAHVGLAALHSGRPWPAAILAEAEAQMDNLFDEQRDELADAAGLASRLVDRYARTIWRPDWTVLDVEKRFGVRIPRTGVVLLGYMDAVIQEPDGSVWLAEFKFPKSRFRSPDDLELDGQIGAYQWAARRLGYNVVGTKFIQVLAKDPTTPKMNKDGSLSRAAITCDWDTYAACVQAAGLNPLDYLDMRAKLSGVQLQVETLLYRPDREIERFGRDLQQRVLEMRRKTKRIYRNENVFNCGMCQFREPCVEVMKGGDVETLLAMAYEPKPPREEFDEEGVRQ